MPKERMKKTLEQASHIAERMDSLGVTQLLDELKHVPFVGSDDGSFNLEDVLAEFGSGKSAKLYNGLQDIKTDIPELKSEPAPVIKKEALAEKKAEASAAEYHVVQAEQIEIPKNKPKMITNIVRPWEDGKFGDLDLSAKPEPTPWKKKNDEETKVNTKASSEKEDTKPLKPKCNSDTITHLPGEAFNELFDDSGETRGFRIKKKESQVVHELPSEYIKREEKRVRGQKKRSILLFLLCLPVCYLIASTQLGWPMIPFIEYAEHPFRFVSCLVAAHLAALVLSYDVFARGIKKLFVFKPNMESVVVFASLMSLLHAVMALVNHGVNIQLPYNGIACITLFFAMNGLYLKNRACLRACKTAGATKEPVGVFVKDFYGDRNVFKHKIEDRETFVGHLTSQDGADRFWSYFSAIVIVASIVFAAVGSYGSGNSEYFIWALAAVSSLSAPLFLMQCYGHPFSVVCKKLSDIGAAIAGWYSACEFTGDLKVILRDTDIFPHGCVKLHGLKVYGRHSLEKTLAYTTSVIKESRSGLYKVFAELLKSQFGKTEKVYGLKYHEHGGVEADVNGDKVFLGTAGFMLRRGLRVSESANVKNAIFIAINSEIAGVFNVTYKVNSEVQNAFDAMKRRKIKLVLATIDFNLTPMMVETHFSLAEGKRLKKKKSKKNSEGFAQTNLDEWDTFSFAESDLIYPEIEKRIDFSSDEQTIDRDPCAVVSRGGFAPMAFSVIAAKRLRRATKRNIFLSAISSVIGMLLMFYLVFCGSIAAATPHNVFIYMMLWAIPAYIVSRRAGEF